MGDLITREEHEEFSRRMEDENTRQNHRLSNLEESVRQIGDLALSVQRLASSMENMVKEQEKQGKRLETLEERDGEKWRKVVHYAMTAVIGIVLGYVFNKIGM